MSDVMKQNTNIGGINCDWDLWGGYVGGNWNGGVESSIPAMVFESVPTTAFLPITTEVSSSIKTDIPVPGRRVEGTPTPTAAI
jgi:hypothetical protein